MAAQNSATQEESRARHVQHHAENSAEGVEHAAHSHDPQTNPMAASSHVIVSPATMPEQSNFTMRGNQPVRSAMMLSMQQTRGNHAVQRMVAMQRTALQRHGNPEDEQDDQVVQTTRDSLTLQRHGNPEDEQDDQAPVQTKRASSVADTPASAFAFPGQRTAIQRSPLAIQRLTTGIAKGKAVGSFVANVKQVQANWATLTPNARGTALTKAANERLKEVNCPPCNASVSNLGGASGQFDFTTWTLQIDSGLVSKASVTDDDMADVADTVYHEARHAEQWWRMARLQAGKGVKADDVKKGMFIPADVAKKATSNPLKATGSFGRAFMSKEKIAEEDQELQEAEAWYKNIYGSGAANRNAVLNGLTTKADAVKAANSDLAAKDSDVAAKLEAANKAAETVNKKVKILDKKNDINDQKMADFKAEKIKAEKVIADYLLKKDAGTATQQDLDKSTAAQASLEKALKSAKTAKKSAVGALKSYEKAKAVYDAAMLVFTNATTAKTGAEKASDTANKENNKNYKAYRGLAEEKDAWKLGGEVKAAYTS